MLKILKKAAWKRLSFLTFAVLLILSGEMHAEPATHPELLVYWDMVGYRTRDMNLHTYWCIDTNSISSNPDSINIFADFYSFTVNEQTGNVSVHKRQTGNTLSIEQDKQQVRITWWITSGENRIGSGSQSDNWYFFVLSTDRHPYINKGKFARGDFVSSAPRDDTYALIAYLMTQNKFFDGTKLKYRYIDRFDSKSKVTVANTRISEFFNNMKKDNRFMYPVDLGE